MTIQIKPETFIDKILKKIGIKRGIANPKHLKKINDALGPHVTIVAKRESLLMILKKYLTRIKNRFKIL